MRGSSRLLFFSFLLFLLQPVVVSFKTHIVYWNKTNPLFRSGEYEISMRVGDSIKIVCPHLEKFEDDDGAYLIIHKDSEFAHMNCMLESPRQLGICDRPFGEKAQLLSTTLRRYRPNDLAIEFNPGQTHYLLSTSSGGQDENSLSQTTNGLCKNHLMRLKIKVDELDQATVVDTTRLPVTSTNRSPPSHSVPIGGRGDRWKERMGGGGGGGERGHPPRRHTKKEKKDDEIERHLNAFSESDIKGLYTYQTGDENENGNHQLSNWESMRMNADEMTGDLRGGYVATHTDYIISEHSSSASFSFLVLSILVLISLR